MQLVIGYQGHVGSVVYKALADKYGCKAVDGYDTGDREDTYIGQHISNAVPDYALYDTIYFFGGCSSIQAGNHNPSGCYHDNITLLTLVAQYMKPSAKLIYASSASVYDGHRDHANEFDYDKMLRQTSHYALSKIAAEQAVALIKPTNALALRLGTVCGPSYNIRAELLINAMVRSAIDTGVINVTNELAYRAYVHPLDIANFCMFYNEYVINHRSNCINLIHSSDKIGTIAVCVKNILQKGHGILCSIKTGAVTGPSSVKASGFADCSTAMPIFDQQHWNTRADGDMVFDHVDRNLTRSGFAAAGYMASRGILEIVDDLVAYYKEGKVATL